MYYRQIDNRVETEAGVADDKFLSNNEAHSCFNASIYKFKRLVFGFDFCSPIFNLIENIMPFQDKLEPGHLYHSIV